MYFRSYCGEVFNENILETKEGKMTNQMPPAKSHFGIHS